MARVELSCCHTWYFRCGMRGGKVPVRQPSEDPDLGSSTRSPDSEMAVLGLLFEAPLSKPSFGPWPSSQLAVPDPDGASQSRPGNEEPTPLRFGC